jgi:uncharacterized membrane protein YhaH (DUF805 family)
MMDFAQAVKSGFKNYVGFEGRASRSEYWYWTLFSIIAAMVAGSLDTIGGFGFFGAIVSLGLFLPSLAIMFRRLHDIDRTAWWILISFTIIGALLLLFWACLRGTVGPNRFGPDPI